MALPQTERSRWSNNLKRTGETMNWFTKNVTKRD